jgi:hypothetical protein
MIDDGELAALTSQPLVWHDLSEVDNRKDVFFAYQTPAQDHELRLAIDDFPQNRFIRSSSTAKPSLTLMTSLLIGRGRPSRTRGSKVSGPTPTSSSGRFLEASRGLEPTHDALSGNGHAVGRVL